MAAPIEVPEGWEIMRARVIDGAEEILWNQKLVLISDTTDDKERARARAIVHIVMHDQGRWQFIRSKSSRLTISWRSGRPAV
ncbi:hypothetical protein GCM10011575_00050 [Microlunatus endophyticus]|uniref:Uncharacterized protein n=1 Tax=Microlunatus endophyticus TaxID=1716077 RepID=A0A917VYR7_9ACTN|nr:hypothetical protein [Microlunatus endophyticus]GGL46100.1 hypothetical protein GCM10011575_00050 [Microlunatus endophyticus]